MHHYRLTTVLTVLTGFGLASCKTQVTSKTASTGYTGPRLTTYSKPLKPMSVYYPQDNDDYHYNHAPMLASFKGSYYILWSAAPKDEDIDVDVVISKSSDSGQTWTAAGQAASALGAVGPNSKKFSVLMQNSSGKSIYNPSTVPAAGKQPDHPDKAATLQSGGLWTDGQTLVAFIQVFDTWYGGGSKLTQFRTTTDGTNWSNPTLLCDNAGQPVQGSMEESPKKYGDRLYATFNVSTNVGYTPVLSLSPFYTTDLTGQSGWIRAKFTPADFKTSANQAKELEGSVFRAGPNLLTVYRNMQENSLLLSKALDPKGDAWGPAVDMIAAGSNKQAANTLRDGEGFFLANPAGSARAPLNLFISKDGSAIDRGFTLLTMNNESVRYPGLYKGIGFSYPSALVDDKGVWIAYGRDKEDIEVILVDPKLIGDTSH